MAVKHIISVACILLFACALHASNLIVVRGSGTLVVRGLPVTGNSVPSMELYNKFENNVIDSSLYQRSTGVFVNNNYSYQAGVTGFGLALQLTQNALLYNTPQYPSMLSSNMTIELFFRALNPASGCTPIISLAYPQSSSYSALPGFSVYANVLSQQIIVRYGPSGVSRYQALYNTETYYGAALLTNAYNYLSVVVSNNSEVILHLNGVYLGRNNIGVNLSGAPLIPEVGSVYSFSAFGNAPSVWYASRSFGDLAQYDGFLVRKGILYQPGVDYAVPSMPFSAI